MNKCDRVKLNLLATHLEELAARKITERGLPGAVILNDPEEVAELVRAAVCDLAGYDRESAWLYVSKLEDELLTITGEQHKIAHRWTGKPFSECDAGFCPRVREILFNGAA